MSVLKVLRQKIAPELHTLYTATPLQTTGGLDPGWRGREHAFQVFFVARMFGTPADLRSGDFAVLSRFVPPLTTLEREAKHAWCSVNGINPVDLSMTFAFFENVPQLRSAITGEGPNGDWHVRYAEDESILDGNFESENEILYIERQLHAGSPSALLDNPYLFLPPAISDHPEEWSARHGPDIHAKISLHCFRYAMGEARSIRNHPTREAAVAWIATNYPDPQTAIRKLIADGGSG